MTETNGPRLVPRPDGRGALLSGGTPGHKGAGGRPPSVLRERLRGTIEERVEILERILDDPETSTSDILRCVDILLRYTLGTKVELEVEQVSTIDPQELREQILERARQVRAALPPADDGED